MGDSHGVAAAKWNTIGSLGIGVSDVEVLQDVVLSDLTVDRVELVDTGGGG